MAKIDAARQKADRREPDEGGDLEQAEVQHRVGGKALVDEEAHHEDGRAGEQADGGGAAPAEVVATHQREHQEEEAHRERDEAHPVDLPASAGPPTWRSG